MKTPQRRGVHTSARVLEYILLLAWNMTVIGILVALHPNAPVTWNGVLPPSDGVVFFELAFSPKRDDSVFDGATGAAEESCITKAADPLRDQLVVPCLRCHRYLCIRRI